MVPALKAPEIEEKLHTEIDSVLGGELATADDVARLPYTIRFFPRQGGCTRPPGR